ncbi:MAG TPA: hypothetical protein VLC09_09650, partial [Polyangiaceae bacterium]|nr:hypothetical protein [Polyangiaceae bacterium]
MSPSWNASGAPQEARSDLGLRVGGRTRGVSMWGSVAALGLLTLACGGAGQGKGAEDPYTRRSTEIVLERCAREGDGVLRLDADLDGRPEVTRQMQGERELCRTVDLDFDGRSDRIVYYDEQGKVRRTEADFDRDGRVDEIATYLGGELRERHRAATLAGRLDTWEFYEGGKLARTERDQNGDGVIDQWWEYPRPECPLIHADEDGDGRPDPSSTIDYCQATGYVPPAAQNEKAPVSHDFQSGPADEAVTEVSNVPAGEAGAATPAPSGAAPNTTAPTAPQPTTTQPTTKQS